MARVVLRLLTDNIVAVRTVALDTQAYARFRKAAEGARYDRNHRCQTAYLDKIPRILVELRKADLPIDIDGKLSQALTKRNAQEWYDDQATITRIDAIDAEIKKRTNGVFSMFGYQKYGSRWMTPKHGLLLADEPGVGKTLQLITSIPIGAPVLVVCPSTAKGVWQTEVKKWRPQIRTRVLEGRNGFRYPEPGEMNILNYDILPETHDVDGKRGRRCDGFLDPVPCPGCREGLAPSGEGFVLAVMPGEHEKDCLDRGKMKPPIRCSGCAPLLDGMPKGLVFIADEGHYLKSGTSRRTQRHRCLMRRAVEKGGRTWVATGTPVENDAAELWSVCVAANIADECFGSYGEFARLFKATPTGYGGFSFGLPDSEVPELVERLRRGMLRRLKADVLPEMPDKLWKEVLVDVDKASLQDVERALKSSGVEVGDLAVRLEKAEEKLKFEELAAARAALAKAKIPAMLEHVEEYEKAGEPLVVFSAHRAPIDNLGKRKGWIVITGDEDGEKKSEAAKAFQDGVTKEGKPVGGVACTISAAGVALTLTRAAVCLFVDLAWTPTKNMQAEDRIHRIGQKRVCQYVILTARHPLDERVNEVLQRKRMLIAAAVDSAAREDDGPEKDAESGEDEFKDRIQQNGEAIASVSGRAIRSMADTEEKRAVLEALHALDFERNDERQARRFAEEGTAIGLSERQWRWATDIAGRGKPREIVEGPKEEKK